ncbi:helix-turn-helix domain-containing protein [Myxococcus llanfairpwllgwyngyllgogerychwyrndrobwllllantysiliogogogochensis]|uniref:Helix-turn-helix domain-containing protein n=1 Tax=Myxococcus llanfairpwllgwyngyllgogerychwyrndrobwllllantysiliogogogochensis TaxID=2590453 RepID=A0A540WXP5_9BACT|nr:helix-turn-helix domain-containing protein [Myxococcus llanfairpwllgwyngyllgogerychwyrndrobwllllantysiliogogogochensis]
MNEVTADGQFEDAWDVERAARYLGISRKTMYRLAASGEVPSFKVGGALRFDPTRLAAWRHSQQRGV